MIFFTSDTHFCHDRDFIYTSRGFSNIEEHDKQIIQNWNSIVSSDDTVYHLGDIMLMNNEQGLEYLKQLNGNIILILGNHDTLNRQQLYINCKNIIGIYEALTIKIKKQHYFLCHYPTITANYDDKPYHSHLINLHGHTHFKDKFYDNNPFMYNVGLDSHNIFPVSSEELEQDIRIKLNELNTLKMKNKNGLL